jgi:hypothetical protein
VEVILAQGIRKRCCLSRRTNSSLVYELKFLVKHRLAEQSSDKENRETSAVISKCRNA